MTSISYERFAEVYKGAVTDVLAHWTEEMQAEMSAHNVGWHPTRYRFDTYLHASMSRYFLAYKRAVRAPVESLCDVGGFLGVFPLTLRRLGYDMCMTEALKYYSGSFQSLFAFVRSEGVSIIDYDPFEVGAHLPQIFDAVFVMAVLEHYPHSLRDFMTNVLAGVGPTGILYIEVPNIAYWPKRVALLRGHTPAPALEDIYTSRVPFTGHHHEFDVSEMHELARLSGLRVTSFDSYNYSVEGPLLRRLIANPVQTIALSLIPSAREVLAMTCMRPAT